MNTRCIAIQQAGWGVKLSGNFRRTRLFAAVVIAILLGGLLSAPAEEPDSKYMRSYYAIEKADALANKGQRDEAKAKYLEAQKVLKDIKAISPTWNTKAVAFRLSYVTERMDALSKPPVAPDAGGSGGTIGVGSGTQSPVAEVKLLSPGNEPRKALRLATKAGEKQKAEMTLQTAEGPSGGELMKIPAFIFALEIETKEVTPEGDINIEMLIEDVTLDEQSGGVPQMAELMKATLGSIKGMVIASTISDRGATKKVQAKYPPGVDPTARQSMEQIKDLFMNAQVLLPEEAVGPDAKWEVTQKIKSQGITIDQKVTQHLVAMEENILTIETVIDQSAANQKVANPAMPQLKLDLTKLTGSIKGQTTVDLSKIFPTSATFDGGGEMVMSTGSGAQAASMTRKTEANIKIESK